MQIWHTAKVVNFHRVDTRTRAFRFASHDLHSFGVQTIVEFSLQTF
jgi:hypothetical protein